jgi:hypothetical protein
MRRCLTLMTLVAVLIAGTSSAQSQGVVSEIAKVDRTALNTPPVK